MSASMAEGIAAILDAHGAWRYTNGAGTAIVCSGCGAPVGNLIAHQAGVLAANGYGKLEDAWDEGYGLGINDERLSEANIGIAGCLCNQTPCQCKIGPARVNPYGMRTE